MATRSGRCGIIRRSNEQSKLLPLYSQKYSVDSAERSYPDLALDTIMRLDRRRLFPGAVHCVSKLSCVGSLGGRPGRCRVSPPATVSVPGGAIAQSARQRLPSPQPGRGRAVNAPQPKGAALPRGLDGAELCLALGPSDRPSAALQRVPWSVAEAAFRQELLPQNLSAI